MKRLLAAAALAVGVGVTLAPTASAQGYVPPPSYKSESQYFVTPLDPDAWTPGAPKFVVVSPFGTKDISCAAWAGFVQCLQRDPSGGWHDLIPIDPGRTGRWFAFNPFARS